MAGDPIPFSGSSMAAPMNPDAVDYKWVDSVIKDADDVMIPQQGGSVHGPYMYP
jgi:hypothetical protein